MSTPSQAVPRARLVRGARPAWWEQFVADYDSLPGWPRTVRHTLPGAGSLDRPYVASVLDIQSVAIECCPELIQPLDGPVAPTGQLVATAPAPCRDHRPHEDVTLCN